MANLDLSLQTAQKRVALKIDVSKLLSISNSLLIQLITGLGLGQALFYL